MPFADRRIHPLTVMLVKVPPNTAEADVVQAGPRPRTSHRESRLVSQRACVSLHGNPSRSRARARASRVLWLHTTRSRLFITP